MSGNASLWGFQSSGGPQGPPGPVGPAGAKGDPGAGTLSDMVAGQLCVAVLEDVATSTGKATITQDGLQVKYVSGGVSAAFQVLDEDNTLIFTVQDEGDDAVRIHPPYELVAGLTRVSGADSADKFRVLDNDDVVAFRVDTTDNKTYIKDLVVDALTIDDPTLTFSNAIVTGNFTVDGDDDADKVRVLDGANVLVMAVNTVTNVTYIKDLNVADTLLCTDAEVDGDLTVTGVDSSTKVVVRDALLETAFSINTSTQVTYIKDLVVDKITLEDPTIAFDSATITGTLTVSGDNDTEKFQVRASDGTDVLTVNTDGEVVSIGTVSTLTYHTLISPLGAVFYGVNLLDDIGEPWLIIDTFNRLLTNEGDTLLGGPPSVNKFAVKKDEEEEDAFRVDTDNNEVFINNPISGSVIQKFTIAQGTIFTTNAGDLFPETTGNYSPPLFDEAFLSPWTTFPVGTIVSAHFKYTTGGYTYTVPMGLWNTYGRAGDENNGKGLVWIGYIQRTSNSVNEIQFFIPNKLVFSNFGFYNMCVQGAGVDASLSLKGTIEVIVLRLITE